MKEVATTSYTAKALRSLALDAARAAGMTEIGEFGFVGRDSRRVQVVTAFGQIDGQRAKVMCGSKGGEFWRVEVKVAPYTWRTVSEAGK